MDKGLQIYKALPKNGEIREYRIHATQVILDDDFQMNLEVMLGVLKELSQKGVVSYIIHDDFATFDKVIKIRKEKDIIVDKESEQ